MTTRSQKFAIQVWKLAGETRRNHKLDDEKNAKKKNQYGGMAHKLPVLIQTCGLAQSLAFVRARGQDPHKWLLDDLATTLGKTSGDAFWQNAREAKLNEYIHLSQQSIEALLWFKRFAQSELGVTDASADDSEAFTDSESSAGFETPVGDDQ